MKLLDFILILFGRAPAAPATPQRGETPAMAARKGEAAQDRAAAKPSPVVGASDPEGGAARRGARATIPERPPVHPIDGLADAVALFDRYQRSGVGREILARWRRELELRTEDANLLLFTATSLFQDAAVSVIVDAIIIQCRKVGGAKGHAALLLIAEQLQRAAARLQQGPVS